MRFTWTASILVLAWATFATAQTTPPWYGGTGVSNPVTVSGLPAAGQSGRVAVVSDGDTASDCSTGAGTSHVLCCDTGNTWTACGSAGGGEGGGTECVSQSCSLNSGTTHNGNTISTGPHTDAFDSTDYGTTTWGTGSDFNWTFDVTGASDQVVQFTEDMVTLTESLTVEGGLTSIHADGRIRTDVSIQILEDGGGPNVGTLSVADITGSQTYEFAGAGGTVWTSGNDGSGTGLDADKLDGNEASVFSTGVHLVVGSASTDAHRGDQGVIAHTHSQAAHAPAGAEVNVQSDWTAGNGDSFIQNKPTITGSNTGDVCTSDHTLATYSTGPHTSDTTCATVNCTLDNGDFINGSSITLDYAADPTPTTRGQVLWDSANDRLTVGDSVGTQVFYPDAHLAVGSASTDAHRGDQGATAYTHSQAAHLAVGTGSTNAHRGDQGATAYTHSQAGHVTVGTGSTNAHRGDQGATAYTHSQAQHAAQGAEVNVQSNWTASSGDSFIQNKPTITGSNTGDVCSTDHANAGYLQDSTDTLNGNLTVTGFVSAQDMYMSSDSSVLTIKDTDTASPGNTGKISFTGSSDVETEYIAVTGGILALNGEAGVILLHDGATKAYTQATGFSVTGNLSTAGDMSMRSLVPTLTMKDTDNGSPNNAGKIAFTDSSNTETASIVAGAGLLILGGDTGVVLTHNGASKLSTTATGIVVSGDATVSGQLAVGTHLRGETSDENVPILTHNEYRGAFGFNEANLNAILTDTQYNELYRATALELEYWSGLCADASECIYDGDCVVGCVGNNDPVACCNGAGTGSCTCSAPAWKDWDKNTGSDSVQELFDGNWYNASEAMSIDHVHRRWRVTVPAGAWSYPSVVRWRQGYQNGLRGAKCVAGEASADFSAQVCTVSGASCLDDADCLAGRTCGDIITTLGIADQENYACSGNVEDIDPPDDWVVTMMNDDLSIGAMGELRFTFEYQDLSCDYTAAATTCNTGAANTQCTPVTFLCENDTSQECVSDTDCGSCENLSSEPCGADSDCGTCTASASQCSSDSEPHCGAYMNELEALSVRPDTGTSLSNNLPIYSDESGQVYLQSTMTGLRVPNGSAAAPALSFTANPDTGIFGGASSVNTVVNGVAIASVYDSGDGGMILGGLMISDDVRVNNLDCSLTTDVVTTNALGDLACDTLTEGHISNLAHAVSQVDSPDGNLSGLLSVNNTGRVTFDKGGTETGDLVSRYWNRDVSLGGGKNLAKFQFYGADSGTGNNSKAAEIVVSVPNAWNGNTDDNPATFKFYTQSDGTDDGLADWRMQIGNDEVTTVKGELMVTPPPTTAAEVIAGSSNADRGVVLHALQKWVHATDTFPVVIGVLPACSIPVRAAMHLQVFTAPCTGSATMGTLADPDYFLTAGSTTDPGNTGARSVADRHGFGGQPNQGVGLAADAQGNGGEVYNAADLDVYFDLNTFFACPSSNGQVLAHLEYVTVPCLPCGGANTVACSP